jgi:hypothetical protein
MMDPFERIPVDVRWKLAARGFSRLPLVYRRVIGNAADDQFYNEVERAIWQEQGKEAGTIARAFMMPVRTAREVAKAFGATSKVFFGQEYRYEIAEVAPDEAVLTMRGCPIKMRAEEMGEDVLAACNVCHAYGNAAVASLNQDFVLRFHSGMCTGDKACVLSVMPGRPER